MSSRLLELHRRVNRLAGYLGDDCSDHQGKESFTVLIKRLDSLIARADYEIKTSKAEAELYRRVKSYG